MKKIYIFTVLIVVLLLMPQTVLAAGTANISGPSSIESGSSVTVDVTINAAAWNLKIVASGATNGCTKSFADASEDAQNVRKLFSATCSSIGTGTITFKVTGDITDENGDNKDINLEKKITVTAKKQETPSTPTTPNTPSVPTTPNISNTPSNSNTTSEQSTSVPSSSSNSVTSSEPQQTKTEETREKESETGLASLSISDYEITPGFSKDVEEYFAELPITEENVTITAQPLGQYAKVEGTGIFKIEEGNNKFEIICIAENGERKTYKLNVAVIDKNPISVSLNGKDYTVVKLKKLLSSPGEYEETVIKINDIEIPAFKSDKNNLIIVGLKDSQDQICYATYSEKGYSLYNENSSKNLLLYIMDGEKLTLKKTTVIINDKEYNAFEINDRFAVIYAMNLNDGECNYYKYDKKDGTFQYYDMNEDEYQNNHINIYVIIICALVVICIIGTIIYVWIRRNKKQN